MNYYNVKINEKDKFRFTIKALDRVPITLEGINNTGKKFNVSSVIALDELEQPLITNEGVVLDFGDILHFYSFGPTPNGLTILKAYDENNRVFFENPKTKEIINRSREYNFDSYLMEKDKKSKKSSNEEYFTKFHNSKLLYDNLGKPVIIIKNGNEFLSVVVDYTLESNQDRIIAIHNNQAFYETLQSSDAIVEFNYYNFLNYEAKKDLKS